MRHTRLWVVATIIAIIIIAGFVLSVPRARDGALPATAPSAKEVVPEVTIRDIYKKGVHTITGSVAAPDACTVLSATATLEGADASSTGNILVDISMPEDTGICLERVTKLTFSTVVTAPAGAPITVRVNGAAAPVTAP